MLKDFAVGPFVFDLTYSAFDAKPVGGSTPTRFVASITVFPSIPSRPSSASATAPPRHGEEHGFHFRNVAALVTDPRHLVSSLLPEIGKPAADVPPSTAIFMFSSSRRLE